MNSAKHHKDPWKVYKEEIPSSTHHFSDRSVCLLESMQSSHLRSLMQSFFRRPSVTSRPNRRVRANSMSFEDFFSTMKEVTGQDYRRNDIEDLFHEMGVTCEDRVDWQMFQTFMLQNYKHIKESMSACKHVPISLPFIQQCTYNKQEPIVRVLALSQSSPKRYVSVSKRGTLIVWNRHLTNIKPLEMSAMPFNKKQHRKRFRGWTTDAAYMANVQKIAVATLYRGIHFFDVTTTSGFEQVHLFGLSHVATTLCYWYDTEAPGEKCVLMWGDENGSVHLLWFLEPFKGLFQMPFLNQSGPVQIFMPEISGHSALVSYQHIPKIHSMSINKILYEPNDELIISSSDSSASSVVIIDVNQKREEYIWRTDQGVKCFDFSFSLGLLVTAGVGPAVRLWNRYVTSRPTAVLHSHQTAVVDVVIHQALGKIFSYSKDAVLKIWDISSQLCINTIRLKFPNIQERVAPEQGRFPLLLDLTAEPVLLVTCREYLAMLRLDKTEAKNTSGPYTCALYNPHLRQVITACADSTLAVWDVKTGFKRMEIRNGHGKEEVSCMALEVDQRRLITGATNGTVKVWNLLNGLNLHKLQMVSNTEVTGIISHQENQLLATGWSRTITQYSIGFSNDIYVKAELSWKSGRQHSEDILAMDHCPSLRLLATGSYDGEIIIWSLAFQKPSTRLQREDALPVHRLLFLQRRAQLSHWRSGAVLLSSQAGYICWWSICGPRHNYGQFYVPDRSGESVMGLSSDQENNLLVTGDTTGSIKIWDVSQYAASPGDLQSVNEPPPLLHAWRGHERAIVSSDVLQVEASLFVLSVSVDAARLWTGDGDCVGYFGQEQQWDLSKPDTYQTNREQISPVKKEEEKRTESSQSRAKAESFICWGESAAEVNQPQTEWASDLQAGYTDLQSPDFEFSSDCSSPLEKLPLPKYKFFSGDHVLGDLEIKRMTWQRREKLCCSETESTPFLALELPEISELEDVPFESMETEGEADFLQSNRK